MLEHAVTGHRDIEVEGETVQEALRDLFLKEPGLRNHILDAGGAIRAHVSIFVDGTQASLDTAVAPDGSIRVLHAVSGGSIQQVTWRIAPM